MYSSSVLARRNMNKMLVPCHSVASKAPENFGGHDARNLPRSRISENAHARSIEFTDGWSGITVVDVSACLENALRKE